MRLFPTWIVKWLSRTSKLDLCSQTPLRDSKSMEGAFVLKTTAGNDAVVPHGLLAQVQQICQCFTETPRGHERDRSRTPDSSHRVLWHLEGKVKRWRVVFLFCFLRLVFGCRRFWQRGSDGRSRVGATCRNLGCCGQRVRSESARRRDDALELFRVSLCSRSEAWLFVFSAVIHERLTKCVCLFCLKRVTLN